MLVSHEVPIALLKKSRAFNDYDYCLVHLLDQYEEYAEFYKESIELGRHVLLDNSIFELGIAFDSDRFAKHVEELNPYEYIVPDALEDYNTTIRNFINFDEKYRGLPGRRIGVVQGKTWEELVDCYRFMSERADKIAISFDYSYYHSIALEGNKWERFTKGRQCFIECLIDENIINKNKPHHLLGCSLPQEFKKYRDFKWVETIDTSNPIVHGIKNIAYTKEGLINKESIKLVDLIEEKNFDEDLIFYNVRMFRGFIV